MKHREIYTELLSPNVRDRLLATLVEEGILRLLGAHGLELEPQAYRLELEMGETWIDVPCAGFRYHCATADELVAIRLADYVVNLERKYVERFPGHEATIQQAMRRWTNDHAGDVFRPPAYERIHQVNACAALMFLAQGSRTRSA